MRVAVTYENGNVFQHFGKSEFFKIYDIENGAVKSAEVVSTNGQGHGALAGVLQGSGVDVLICGGIGMGAQNALAAAGVELYAGASGNTDEVVASFLAGTLVKGSSNCNHHHNHGEGGCGHHHSEGGCGHHDHGEGGCCH